MYYIEIDSIVQRLLDSLPLPDGATVCKVRTGPTTWQWGYFDPNYLHSSQNGSAKKFKIAPIFLMPDQARALERAGAKRDHNVYPVDL